MLSLAGKLSEKLWQGKKGHKGHKIQEHCKSILTFIFWNYWQNLPDQILLQRTRTQGIWPDQTTQSAAEGSDWWTASKAPTEPEHNRRQTFSSFILIRVQLFFGQKQHFYPAHAYMQHKHDNITVPPSSTIAALRNRKVRERGVLEQNGSK